MKPVRLLLSKDTKPSSDGEMIGTGGTAKTRRWKLYNVDRAIVLNSVANNVTLKLVPGTLIV